MICERSVVQYLAHYNLHSRIGMEKGRMMIGAKRVTRVT